MREITVAFIGITHPHSSGRFRALEAIPGVRISGAWDEDPTALLAFCDEVNAQALSLDQALGAEDVDGIVVHSKSKDMLNLTKAACQAGKGVLVEKPGGASLADLETLVSLADSTARPIRVGYNFHFAPALDVVRRALSDGSVGRVSMVHGHGASSRGEHLSQHLNQPADMGGALWVIGCHVLHLMIELMGVPTSVRATVEKWDQWSDSSSREDAATVTLVYPDRLGTFTFTVHDELEWFETSEVTFYGDGGTARFGVLPGFVEVRTRTGNADFPAGRTQWDEGRFVVPWTGSPSPFTELAQIGNITFFAREAEEFIGALRGDSASGVTPLTALHIAQVISAAYESSERGGVSVHI